MNNSVEKSIKKLMHTTYNLSLYFLLVDYLRWHFTYFISIVLNNMKISNKKQVSSPNEENSTSLTMVIQSQRTTILIKFFSSRQVHFINFIKFDIRLLGVFLI